MKKSLAEWASIAEIFGAIAIVVTLIFVAFEIRDNTRATQAATFQQHASNEIGLIHIISSDPQLLTVYQRAQFGEDYDFEETGGSVERAQGNFLVLSALRLWEDLYIQYEAGAVSESAWRSREPTIRAFVSTPIFAEYVEDEVISGAFAEWALAVRESASQ